MGRELESTRFAAFSGDAALPLTRCTACGLEGSRETFASKTRCRPCKRADDRDYYSRNSAKVRARVAAYALENAERVQARERAYRERPECRAAAVVRATAWAEKNPERAAMHRATERERSREKRATYNREWKKRNKDRVTASTVDRQARMRRQTLPLSEAQREQMMALYREAALLTEITRIKHHVDHEVPLRGRNVSGLHVPWNMRVLPAKANLRKSNRWTG